MKSNRLWLAGTVIVVIAVIALGWVLGIQPRLTEAAVALVETQRVDALNEVEQAKLLALKKEFEEIDEIRGQVEELELSIPTKAELAAFIRQVNDLAALNGVTVINITTADAAAYVLPEGATVLDAEGQPVPAPIAPANLVLVPMNIKVEGPYASVLSFIKGLQAGNRLYMVNDVAVAKIDSAPDPENEDAVVVELFGGELEGQVYVLVDPSVAAEETAEEEAAAAEG